MSPKLKLLILCTLSASALNVLAENFVVTSDTTVSDTHYENQGEDYAALTNEGTWTFTGSNLTLTGTADSGYGSIGVVYWGGTLNLTDSTVNANYRGIAFENATGTLNNVNSTAEYAITVNANTTLTVTGGTIRGSNVGIMFFDGTNNVTLNNVNIAGDTGVQAWGEDIFLTMTGGTVSGYYYGIDLRYGVTGTLNNVYITARDVGVEAWYNNPLTMTGGTITAGNGMEIYASSATLNNVTVTATGNNGFGVGLVDTSANLTLNDSTVSATGTGAHGLYLNDYYGNGSANIVTLNHSTLAGGIYVLSENNYYTGPITITASNGSVITGGVTVETRNDSEWHNGAVALDFTVSGSDSNFTGDLTVSGSSTVTLTGNDHATVAIDALTASDDSILTVNGDGNLTISGPVTASDNATLDLTLTGNNSGLTGAITGSNDSAITLAASNGATINSIITGTDTTTINLTVTGSDSTFTGDLTASGNSTVTLASNDHATLTGTITASDAAALTLTASNGATISSLVTANDTTTLDLTATGPGSTFTGTITANNDSQITLTGANGSVIIGDVIGNDNASADLTITGNDTWYVGNLTASGSSTVTLGGDGNLNLGNLTASGSATLDLTLTGSHSSISGNLTTADAATLNLHTTPDITIAIGNLTASGNTTLDLALTGSKDSITGTITASDDSAITLTASNGATISGPITGHDVAVITLTVSGPGSAITGDLAQHDHSLVTLNLNNGATGRGAWDGGTLTLGAGSEWAVTGNSRLANVSNDGTFTVGHHQVNVNTFTHTGAINLSVNSDTGAAGALTVTDTADGEGRVHVDTTGNGQLNPNHVLPGLVSGDGTEHWQWDPIDWGIDTIIKDGDHFIKQGTSPAGAVLNSSVAIQQAMWFAQQNSLLKRMGELRYGTRASRPPAGGTPALHNLIDNIWLRSYGQQLNVGSQVAGKAYEQLIYGVDLGTDHKFTLSADSDLYLGVYAGYGRSDLDYRTPDTDGEINSYYGGLYATWLHSSGFYIDATFKAASVDNNLKAPYGTTQLTANYSDINLGGSLELGKKFTFTDDWFIEPQFQVNYLHILAEDYSAAPLTISAQDLDALQFRIGSLFGRTINLTNSGALQPYIKVSGVETISSGGTIRNGYQHTRANTDGARAEVGGGIIWQLDANNQLHLDYEASFGDKYDKPWGLTAGYRHQF